MRFPFLFSLALSALALGQQQAKPVFRSSVSYVQLDVTVTDASGRIVRGLAADDFEVRESGRLQVIDFARLVDVPAAKRELDYLRPSIPSIDVFSNVAPQESHGAFVIVVDEGSLDNRDLIPAKEAVTRFISQLRPDDRVAMTFMGRSDLGRDFTRDPAVLMEAVDGISAALGSAATVDLGAVMRSSQDRVVFNVLMNAIATLAKAEELRRGILYVSRGAMGSRGRDRVGLPGWRVVFDRATRTGVRIHTWHPEGLQAPALGLQGALEDQTPERRAALDGASRGSKDFLRVLAANTGGVAVVDHHEGAESVDQVVEDMSHYYVLGYRPSPYKPDGKFHRVDVRVRHPGLRVRARRGYLAPDGRQRGNGGASMEDALASGLPGGNLGLRAFGAPISWSLQGGEILVVAEVSFEASGPAGERPRQVSVAWVAIDPDAKKTGFGQTALDVPMVGGAGILTLAGIVPVRRGTSSLRLAVSSDANGTWGTVHLPVPTWDREADGPLLLPLLVTRQGESRDALAFGPLPTFPIPTLDRAFERTERIQVSAALVGALVRDTAVSCEVVRDGRTVLRPAVIVNSQGTELIPDTRQGRLVEATIDLSTLASGEYQLQVTAVQGGRESRRAVRFVVE